MTKDEALAIFKLCTYKPGWSFHFGVEHEGTPYERWYAQVGVDITTEASMDASKKGHPREAWKGGKRYFSEHMCEQEIVGLAFGLVCDAEMHETKEWFRFMGASIHNPHIHPKVLVEVARKKSSFNVRQNNAMNPD